VPDAEVSWPDVPASAYAGECWAIEAELTPKPLARTAAIMAGLLARTADQQPAAPPGLGPHDIPLLTGTVDLQPEHIQAAFYQAFDIQALYKDDMHQVTIFATTHTGHDPANLTPAQARLPAASPPIYPLPQRPIGRCGKG
jgi:hypothetical protein